MGNRGQSTGAVLVTAAVWAVLCGLAVAQGGVAPDAPVPQAGLSTRVLSDRLPAEPSLAPSAAIAVEPLGFSAPAALALGLNNSFVSLDFLDENRLLFTFKVPGLVHRGTGANEERTIRAVVLAVPSGQVLAESVWTLHDRARYLWTLPNGQFLLRDGQDLQSGDAALTLKPALHFPGRLEFLQLDPSGSYLVTNSREPRPAASQSQPAEAEMVVRILRRADGQVVNASRSPSALKLAVNAEGVVLTQQLGRGLWNVLLNRFAGGATALGWVESECQPEAEFVAPQMFLTVGCAAEGGMALAAKTTTGRTMWTTRTQGMAIGQQFVRAVGGMRLARVTLGLERPYDGRGPVDASLVKGQLVQVIDALDGRVALETTASPVLDAGGNVALSPSGRRVAVLNAGAIQLFELPAAPVIPVLVPGAASH